MIENQKIRPAQVIGPLGEPLTLDTLPPPQTTRWVVRRKAEVVAADRGVATLRFEEPGRHVLQPQAAQLFHPALSVLIQHLHSISIA